MFVWIYSYDVVYGPIANDRVGLQISQEQSELAHFAEHEESQYS